MVIDIRIIYQGAGLQENSSLSKLSRTSSS
jgi:hypothetical protein